MTAAPTNQTWTAAECAQAWDVKESTWRAYVAAGRAPGPQPGFDDQRRRRWSPTEVTEWPRPGQGARTDRPGHQVGELAAIILDLADELDTDTVPRARLRTEWIESFPEHVDATKPVHGGGTAVEAPRARRRLNNALVKLEKGGTIRRVGEVTVTIVDRAALEDLAAPVPARSGDDPSSP